MAYKYEANQQPYRIQSIVPTNPPKGAEGSGWFQYVIVQGDNQINGYRQGSRQHNGVAVANVDIHVNMGNAVCRRLIILSIDNSG